MSTRLRTSIEATLGIVVTGTAIFLGAAWPSLLTLIAVPVLPAPALFVWYAIAPRVFEKRRAVRVYMIVATLLGAASILVEAWWLAAHAEINIR